jgi:hypothetical protein
MVQGKGLRQQELLKEMIKYLKRTVGIKLERLFHRGISVISKPRSFQVTILKPKT